MNDNTTETLINIGVLPFSYDKPLFKFVDYRGAKDIITNQRLKFSNPFDFSDLFDMNRFHLIDYSLNDIQLLKYLSSQKPIFDENKISSIMNHPERINYIKKSTANSLEKLKNEAKVLCMTTDIYNSKMWEIYQREKKNICLAFNFVGENGFTDKKFSFMHVNYSDIPIKKNIYLNMPDALVNWITCKSKKLYGFENEVRCIYFGPNPYQPIRKSYLKAVIYGNECPNDIKNQIEKLLKNGYSVDFYKIRKESEIQYFLEPTNK